MATKRIGSLSQTTDPKPGYMTTEFWVTILTVVGAFVLIGFGRVSVDQVVNLWPVFAGSGLYSVSRGVAKMTQ